MLAREADWKIHITQFKRLNIISTWHRITDNIDWRIPLIPHGTFHNIQIPVYLANSNIGNYNLYQAIWQSNKSVYLILSGKSTRMRTIL